MLHDNLITHLPIQLRADPSRVVIRPFVPADDPVLLPSPPRPRAQRIVDRVLALDDAALEAELDHVSANMAGRHRDIQLVLRRRFHEINGLFIDHCSVKDEQAFLIGAYFSEEYAFEAAALFNPSIVAHPDQAALLPGELRFILSLRAVGEGHVSSVTFRTGVCGPDGAVAVDNPGAYAVAPRIENIPGGVPDDPGPRLICEESHNLSETVIFPMTLNQRHGIEDMRLVRFTDDDGNVTYYGTYTAFSGQSIRQELLRTTDFATFELNALRGEAANGKGMALFPRRIDGRYAMLGRQDHENIWLLTSSDLYDWHDGGQVVVTPRWPWEFIQIGNGGSPIEIEEGWLVITHGVGAVRNYCLGVCLLDRDDPTKLLGRMTHPLLRPSAEERFGYVPNVAYTCGAMIHGRTLVLPYAVADSYTTFATIPIDQLLLEMA
ncbi:MAG: glycoside hydrolase family 130 protein [Sphingomonas bacterium]|nr:glycoside hydrolase family 130 protein [Sphingomonas bacterium]